MNVKELRGKLDSIPDDYEVYLYDWNEEYKPQLKLEIEKIYVNDSDNEVILGLEI